MGPERTDTLETQISLWRSFVRRRRELAAGDVAELEDHLRDQVSDLERAGLSDDEAFLVAVKRMGRLDEVSREFAREHSERLWKQLVLTDDGGAGQERRDLIVAVCFAVGAALAVRAPSVFGLDLVEDAGFYQRNLSLLVLPFLTAYFAWKRGLGLARSVRLLVPPFVVGGVVANAYPFAAPGATEVLLAIHLPIALWFVVAVAYAGGEWRAGGRRMDAVRFTGEWFIYYVLIGLGGGVLTALSVAAFGAIGVDLGPFASEWLLPCGAAGAVVVAAWLVEAKQSVVENMAPVLTKVFTPLFTLLLLAFLGAVAWTRTGIDIERDLLIIFDLLLVLVLGLLLYAVSARDPQAPPGAFDRLQLVLVVSALAVDVLVLLAVAARVSTWGISPNKAAALGLNIVLLVNLGRSAWLSLDALRGRRTFAAVEAWQTGYLPAFAVWAAIVAVVFPPVFAFA